LKETPPFRALFAAGLTEKQCRTNKIAAAPHRAAAAREH
jgi:hypothetical protein